jgi:hypothetical protein
MNQIGRWTGLEATLFRLARRMTVKEFADHLGTMSRIIGRWSSRGRSIRPRREYQTVSTPFDARPPKVTG